VDSQTIILGTANGLFLLVIGYLLYRRKHRAEADRTEAEARKAEAEARLAEIEAEKTRLANTGAEASLLETLGEEVKTLTRQNSETSSKLIMAESRISGLEHQKGDQQTWIGDIYKQIGAVEERERQCKENLAAQSSRIEHLENQGREQTKLIRTLTDNNNNLSERLAKFDHAQK
jgi:chromosome segregation ATPase